MCCNTIKMCISRHYKNKQSKQKVKTKYYLVIRKHSRIMEIRNLTGNHRVLP